MNESTSQSLWAAIQEGNVAFVQNVCQADPSCLHDASLEGRWIHAAATAGHVDVLAIMLQLGANINLLALPEENTPLCLAISFNQFEAARFLIDRGANPNLGRPIISAINCDDEEMGLLMVQLLVERGAEVDVSFPWMGDESMQFTPLSFAEDKERHRIAAYLRSKLVGGESPVVAPLVAVKHPDEIVAEFAHHFGKPSPKALLEIVPGDPAVAVHVIPPSSENACLTAFTVGLSTRAMAVPPGEEDYRFAELFIQLPGNWKYREVRDPAWNWPFIWMRMIAKYPHHHKTWLGGSVTVLVKEEPPEPIAPGTAFNSMLLLAERDFKASDGKLIQFYRMAPLYPEERTLEQQRGISALLRAFDTSNVSFVVDMQRINVGVR